MPSWLSFFEKGLLSAMLAVIGKALLGLVIFEKRQQKNLTGTFFKHSCFEGQLLLPT